MSRVRGSGNIDELAKALLGRLKEVNCSIKDGTATYSFGELIDLVTCVVCGGMMDDPHFIDDCEHMFCKRCVYELKGETCPGSMVEPTCTTGTYLNEAVVKNMKRCKLAADIVTAIEKVSGAPVGHQCDKG